MRNAYRLLLDSGLPIDWTVIVLGWRHGAMTRDQLLSYAMDRIGYDSPEVEPLVAELAYVDPGDIWTIERVAAELESTEVVERRHAMGVWRWVLFSQLIANIRAQVDYVEAANTDGAALDDYQTGWWCSVFEFWGDDSWLQEPNDIPQVDRNIPNVFAYWRAVLDIYTAWLRREFDELAPQR